MKNKTTGLCWGKYFSQCQGENHLPEWWEKGSVTVGRAEAVPGHPCRVLVVASLQWLPDAGPEMVPAPLGGREGITMKDTSPGDCQKLQEGSWAHQEVLWKPGVEEKTALVTLICDRSYPTPSKSRWMRQARIILNSVMSQNISCKIFVTVWNSEES